MPTIKTNIPRPWLPKSKPFDGATRSFDYSQSRWKQLRDLKRRANPLCEECNRNGIVKAAELIDHITPIIEGGDSLDFNNLQSLCRGCHEVKTAKEIGRRRQNNNKS